MSPVRWARRKSSSSESERNCYNVQTSQVTTERASQKKDKKRIQDERRRSCEKRNPLLDRVKNTRLSFFRDREAEAEHEPEDDTDKTQFRSMCELSRRGLTRNEFRRSVCEIDLKQVTEEEKIQAKRKRRCKSQSRLPSRKNLDERFGFLGFGGSTSQKSPQCQDEANVESPKPRRRRWQKSKDSLGDRSSSRKSINVITSEDPEAPLEEGSQYDSVTPSSCLAAKFRAMQDRYLKSSTSKLIAKIYRKDGKDRDKRRLRSFSYGTLPGLEELRTNPLFEDQDQDDNDSGILDNGSATSSLLDDRCSSGASGFLTVTNDCSSPPQLPPRRPSATLTEIDKKLYSQSESNNEQTSEKCIPQILLHNSTSIIHNLSLGIERDPLNVINQASNEELIQRKIGLDARLVQSLGRKEILDRTENDEKHLTGARLPVVRSRSYTMETTVVKLPRETADQCLGIFIAKTSESSPGYLVAHVVPNGLADKEGTLRIGDEILIVNGKRLRGLSMAEARKILGNGSGPGEVDIVVSRYIGVDDPKRLKESSVDYENISVENGHVINNNNNNIININNNNNNAQTDSPCSPKSHFRKHQSRHHRDRKNQSNRSISSEKSNVAVGDNGPQSISNFCTLPRRPRSSVSTFHTVVFEKGQGKKSLGFTIVGGRDSPKGSIGE